MSPEVEQPRAHGDLPVLDAPPQPEPPAPPTGSTPRPGHGAHADHHLLREGGTDRWRWRAKIRANAHQLRVYRVVVGVLGTLLVCLGFVSGPLPGPGGIPLVLLGLAVLASEFVWAQRLMQWFKAQLHTFRSWGRHRQALAWLVFFAGCLLLGWGYLLTIGPPAWLPASVDVLLTHVPGV